MAYQRASVRSLQTKFHLDPKKLCGWMDVRMFRQTPRPALLGQLRGASPENLVQVSFASFGHKVDRAYSTATRTCTWPMTNRYYKSNCNNCHNLYRIFSCEHRHDTRWHAQRTDTSPEQKADCLTALMSLVPRHCCQYRQPAASDWSSTDVDP